MSDLILLWRSLGKRIMEISKVNQNIANRQALTSPLLPRSANAAVTAEVPTASALLASISTLCPCLQVHLRARALIVN